MALTTDVKERKATPIATGFIDYFPDAIAEVAVLSRIGNDQHNPGKPLHWDRSKSGDESEALMRHFIERGLIDTDGVRHSAKVAWRAMALLQKEIEAEQEDFGDMDKAAQAEDASWKGTNRGDIGTAPADMLGKFTTSPEYPDNAELLGDRQPYSRAQMMALNLDVLRLK